MRYAVYSLLVWGALSAPCVAASGSGMPVACTMEAKLCPDGSGVGRIGPHCEFAPCPGQGAGAGEAAVPPAPSAPPAMGAGADSAPGSAPGAAGEETLPPCCKK